LLKVSYIRLHFLNSKKFKLTSQCRMPKGTYLNYVEIAQILALRSSNIKIAQIAKTIGRSRNVVENFIKKGDNYGKKRKLVEIQSFPLKIVDK